jgi:hypothetical protein
MRISDCGFVESLRSINYNGPFDTQAHDRPFDKKAHDRQNSLNLKLHSTCRGTKMGLKSLSENKQFSPSQVASKIHRVFVQKGIDQGEAWIYSVGGQFVATEDWLLSMR